MADGHKLYEVDQKVSIGNKQGVSREVTRYLFCIGNHIEPRDRFSLNAPMGGIWVGHSEVEGAPTMKRTKYMLHACAVTPLETTAIPKKAGHREEKSSDENFLTGPGVPAGVRGYTVYPGNDIGFLQSDRFRNMGVVELTGMAGMAWDSGDPVRIQQILFPSFYTWANDPSSFPKTIKERLEALNPECTFEELMAQVRESARLFTSYGKNHIEKNRQLIFSMRSVNMGGYTIGWNELSRLYSSQLEVPLEDQDEIKKGAPKIDMASNSEILNLLKSQAKTNEVLTSLLVEMRQSKDPEAVRVAEMIEDASIPDISSHQADFQEWVQQTSPMDVDGPPAEEFIEETVEKTGLTKEEAPIISNETKMELVGMAIPDGQCHGTRKKTGERCAVKNLPSGVTYCDLHLKSIKKDSE